MKTRGIISVLVVVMLFGCTKSEVNRAPDSLNEVIEIPNNLELASKQLLEFLNSKEFTPANCAPMLTSIFDGVFNKDADYFDRTVLGASALPTLSNLWLAKLALRERLKEFHADQTITKDCVKSSRSVLRAIRFTEDYIGAAKLEEMQKNKPKRKAFTGGFPYLLLNPNENDFTLQSGDVLLSRGMAFTSAAIARIGDDDAQFSHLAIVYIDEATNEKYVVEAHIEIGAKVATLDEYASDGKARALVFRQADKDLAKLAAKKIYDLVTAATESGTNVPYDFGMNLKDREELFCTEVVEYAYDLAAQELQRSFKMPKFSTTFSMKNRTFLENIGVKVRETFAPADIEVDPQFQLVAEWRDYGRIRTTHYHDAILTEMFEWMEERDYVLKTDPVTFLTKNLLWHARRWPLFSELLKSKFPENMSKNALGTMMLLNDVAGELFEVLETADTEYKKSTGLWMTSKQLRDALENFRKQDIEVYKKYETNNRGGHPGHPRPAVPAPKIHFKFRTR